jgi:uncharacterized protein YjbI with pentapeptide repeats
MENLPDDVIFHVVLEYLNVLELIDLSQIETNPTLKKLILKKIEEHPDNYYRAVWQGPRTNTLWGYGPFILPENYKICYFKEANLEGADLYRANLAGVNLEGANLFGAFLACANLEGANLYTANLRYANLEGANLESAYLRCAILHSANLVGANLKDANLMGANLIDANFKVAKLKYADLENAKTNDPNFHKNHPRTILVE